MSCMIIKYSVCVHLPSYALLRVTFCVIITVSQNEGLAVFCKLELDVLRRENQA